MGMGLERKVVATAPRKIKLTRVFPHKLNAATAAATAAATNPMWCIG